MRKTNQSPRAVRAPNKANHDFTGYPLNFYGSKHRILENIAELIDDNVMTIADPFGGTGILSWYFKSVGYRTLTNDVLRYSHLCHKVLIANNDITLTTDEIEMLLSPNAARKDYFQRHYRRAFGIDAGVLLDNWASNIQNLSNPVKRDIATFLPIACLRKKIKHCQIHFTTAGTIAGVYPEAFITLEKDIRSYATNILPRLVINKGTDCKVFNEDAVQLIPIMQADVLYLDTPYAGSAGNYEAAYAMLDDLVVALSGNENQIVDLCDRRLRFAPIHLFR